MKRPPTPDLYYGGKIEMPSFDTARSYAGADYIRVTHQDQRKYGEWLDILMPEFLAEERAGRRQKLRGLLGYYGRLGEHAFCGYGPQGVMAQASGSFANHAFYPLTHSGGRASRIDLQVTTPVGCHPSEFIRYTFLSASAHNKGRGKPTTVAIHDTNYGARMLTIGSRQSEVYGRIYDKYAESKQEEYKGMVRFEIEIKGQEARSVQNFLADDRLLFEHSRDMVAGWFTARGVEHSFNRGVVNEYVPESKRTRTDASSIAWLATQVRGTVSRLVQRDLEIEVAAALLPDGASDEMLDRLAMILIEAWSLSAKPR